MLPSPNATAPSTAYFTSNGLLLTSITLHLYGKTWPKLAETASGVGHQRVGYDQILPAWYRWVRMDVMGGRTNAKSGFTLIELMVTVAIIGVLASVAIPAFTRYVRKAQSIEPRIFLQKLGDGLRSYYMDSKYIAVGATLVETPAQYPHGLSGGFADFNGDPVCCAQSGPNEVCQPIQALWANDEMWSQIAFSMDDPHRYVYAYDAGPGPEHVDIWARGDLDCDSEFSYFWTSLVLETQYGDQPFQRGIRRTNELE